MLTRAWGTPDHPILFSDWSLNGLGERDRPGRPAGRLAPPILGKSSRRDADRGRRDARAPRDPPKRSGLRPGARSCIFTAGGDNAGRKVLRRATGRTEEKRSRAAAIQSVPHPRHSASSKQITLHVVYVVPPQNFAICENITRAGRSAGRGFCGLESCSDHARFRHAGRHDFGKRIFNFSRDCRHDNTGIDVKCGPGCVSGHFRAGLDFRKVRRSRRDDFSRRACGVGASPAVCRVCGFAIFQAQRDQPSHP